MFLKINISSYKENFLSNFVFVIHANKVSFQFFLWFILSLQSLEFRISHCWLKLADVLVHEKFKARLNLFLIEVMYFLWLISLNNRLFDQTLLKTDLSVNACCETTANTDHSFLNETKPTHRILTVNIVFDGHSLPLTEILKLNSRQYFK